MDLSDLIAAVPEKWLYAGASSVASPVLLWLAGWLGRTVKGAVQTALARRRERRERAAIYASLDRRQEIEEVVRGLLAATSAEPKANPAPLPAGVTSRAATLNKIDLRDRAG